MAQDDVDRSSRLADMEHADRFREGSPLDQIDEPERGEGSTRFEDFVRTPYELRRRLRQNQSERVEQARQNFAGGLRLADDQVRSVQLDDRGEQIGFAPDDSGKKILAERFADARPFVEKDDVLVDADPRDGVETRTDPDATDTIASRAQQDFAGDDQFAEPGDFEVSVGPGGVEDAGLTDAGARRRAGRQFQTETPLTTIDTSEDIRAAEGGFELTTSAQRRLSARQLESQFDVFDAGSLNPTDDVRAVDGAFGLSSGAAREVAADDLDQQIPEVDIGPDDIELDETVGGSFEATFETEL